MGYQSEAAFRAALTSRLSRAASQHERWSRDDLARAYALQVFLGRLFTSATAPRWTLAGGTALQYRAPEQARPTTDADLYAHMTLTELTDALTAAAQPRPGEFGRFTVTVAATSTTGLYTGSVHYELDGKRVAAASLDIATQRELVLPPVTVVPAPVVDIDSGYPQPTIRMNAPAEALADKAAAMYELHGRTGDVASTRPHDLVDLVILSHTQTFTGADLDATLSYQQQRRGITIPRPLTVPNPTWYTHYPTRARDSGLPAHLHDLDTALAAANTVLEPVLSGAVDAHQWNPHTQTWQRSTDAPTPRPTLGALLEATKTSGHDARRSPSSERGYPPATDNHIRDRSPAHGYDP